MSASATQGGHKKYAAQLLQSILRQLFANC